MRLSRRLVALLAVGGVVLPLTGALAVTSDRDSGTVAAAAATGTPGFAVPKAKCGPGSKPETGLQGQVPMVDQISGRSMEGYRCNLELVGQYTGDGGAIMMAWHRNCAYMPTGYPFADPEFEQRKG